MNRERILYEDRDIIVCHKAAGIATQTARVGQADMVSEVMNYLSRAAQESIKAGSGYATQSRNAKSRSQTERQEGASRNAPYVGVVHRLDQPVEGILVFAKNRRAAAELGRQIAENRMEKRYYAVVCGHDFAQSGVLTDYLVKDGRTNTSRIVPPEVKGAKRAVLEYEILSETLAGGDFSEGNLAGRDCPGRNASERSEKEAEALADRKLPRMALAQIKLETGRHHQIRVQMSRAGMSLLGDHKYADAQTVMLSEQMHVKEIALCAYRLSFRHPTTGKKMQFRVKPEGKGFEVEAFRAYYEMGVGI